MAYYALAENAWNAAAKRPEARVVHNFGGADQVDRAALQRLVRSINRVLAGLTARCELDQASYPKGIAVLDAELAAINIKPAEFQGEWNYTSSSRRADRAVGS